MLSAYYSSQETGLLYAAVITHCFYKDRGMIQHCPLQSMPYSQSGNFHPSFPHGEGLQAIESQASRSNPASCRRW